MLTPLLQIRKKILLWKKNQGQVLIEKFMHKYICKKTNIFSDFFMANYFKSPISLRIHFLIFEMLKWDIFGDFSILFNRDKSIEKR